MTTRDDDGTQDAPPGWVLRTPTRRREVWTLPALLPVLAGVAVLVGESFGDPLARGTGVITAVVAVAGAVAMSVAGRHAYVQQTWGASWDLHRTTVVAGATTGAVRVGGGTAFALFAAVLSLVHVRRAARAPSE